MKYKKGQIVPRRLVTAKLRKAQHCIKFGCDAEVQGKKVTALSDGYLFLIPSKTQRKRRNGTMQTCGNIIENVRIFVFENHGFMFVDGQ